MDSDLIRKCSYSACQKGFTRASITVDALSIRFDLEWRWPPEDKVEFCSILCLSDAVREDMGIR